MTTETEAAPAVDDNTPAPEVIEGQPTEQPAADAGAEPDGEQVEGEQPPPKRQTAQERIDELTRARREAEREAEFWKSKAIPAKEPEPAEQPKADDRPDPAAYQFGETDPEFIEALGAFAARQEFIRLRNEDQQTSTAKSIAQADADRRAAFAKANPDFQEKVNGRWACTPIMADEMRASELGPAVAYQLANNPEEAARIAQLDPRAQIRAIGAIEGRLTPATQPKPAGKVASDAPPPPPVARGTGGQFAPTLRDDLPIEEWTRLRNEQLRSS